MPIRDRIQAVYDAYGDERELSEWEIQERKRELKKATQYRENTGGRYPKGTYQPEALKRNRKRIAKESTE